MKSKNINKDVDEENDGVSYEKGREFEEQFARFMKDDLKWDKIRIGAHMSGHENAKGTSIDILGERLDFLGIKYRKIADKWMAVSIAFALGGIIWHIEKWGERGLWFTLFALTSFAAGLIFRILSDANNKQNAWVECKNLKSKVNINHMSKMLREYNDFKSSKNEHHRFTHLYFASANGYIENTLKMALDNNVICYEKKVNSFREVNYWDAKK